MRRRIIRWLLPLVSAAAVSVSWWVLDARANGAGAMEMEMPPAGAGERLALVLTGEGRRPSASVQELVMGLARGGLPTIAIGAETADATPGMVGERVDSVLRDLMARWHRGRIVLVGYHEGAGMAPFVANRIGADLRSRIDLLALAGLQPRVGFRRGPGRWLERLPRPTDLPVIPELERLRGIPVLCVDRESSSREVFCSSLAHGLVQRRSGVDPSDDDRGGDAVARRILASIR